MSSQAPVVVVGAGLAGLACTLRLAEAGVPVRLLEASDGPGGRVRSDRVEGFRLDRGFQVHLTAYPEARRLLDYDELDLRRFAPGARVRRGGRFRTVADPARRPSAALATLLSGVAGPGDAWRILRLRARLAGRSLAELETATRDRSTLEALRAEGFSSRVIEGFFRPFFGGVFLERELATSSAFFDFSFAMFARGHAAIPARGMGEIPAQLARRLGPDVLQLDTPVGAVEAGAVHLADGSSVEARAVVVATDPQTTAQLIPGLETPPMNAVGCLHFDAPAPPLRGPWLVLDADADGPVNNLCVPSEVAPEYAPRGRALVSASVLGACAQADAELEAAVRAQLRGWFGPAVDDWRLLRIQRIPSALPRFAPGHAPALGEESRCGDGLYLCGDGLALPSIQGALASGRRAAEALLRETANSPPADTLRASQEPTR